MPVGRAGCKAGCCLRKYGAAGASGKKPSTRCGFMCCTSKRSGRKHRPVRLEAALLFSKSCPTTPDSSIVGTIAHKSAGTPTGTALSITMVSLEQSGEAFVFCQLRLRLASGPLFSKPAVGGALARPGLAADRGESEDRRRRCGRARSSWHLSGDRRPFQEQRCLVLDGDRVTHRRKSFGFLRPCPRRIRQRSGWIVARSPKGDSGRLPARVFSRRICYCTIHGKLRLW